MYKQAPKSPAMKALVGNQKNLPQALKAQIEASPAKNMNKGYGSPAKLAPGETNKKAAPKPTAPKVEASNSSSARSFSDSNKIASRNSGGKTDLNSLIKSRKGLDKGSNEYKVIQNKINTAMGSKKRYAEEPTIKAKKASVAPKTPTVDTKKVTAAAKPTSSSKPKANTVKVKETLGGAAAGGKTKLVTKTNGGANKGGTTKKETVTRNKKKVVIKDGDTRTVIKRDNKGARITDTKTTKRVGAKIKGAIKTAKLNRLDRVAKKQAAKAKGSGKKPGSKTEIFG
tara:strand:- start:362 stop:1213 length:852 start_codon:yes stop_codon:yes gene_type:complete